MHDDTLLFSIFLVFSGAAIAATLALYLRQALIVGYLVLGMLLGPWGIGWVDDPQIVSEIARIGIIFLLFLLGLNLSPLKLLQLFREVAFVTLISALIFAGTASVIALSFGFARSDALIIGLCASFSSTIIGLKLLPTTVLHHRRTGEIIISVLLLQDLIAIIAMLVLGEYPQSSISILSLMKPFVVLPVAGIIAWAGYRFFVLPLLAKFDRFTEYIFLLTIGWCLGIAQFAESIGVSYEIGAFMAGVILAAHPVSLHISETLKPLRDFFLVMFFFSVGAGFDFAASASIALPAILIAATLICIKPLVFRYLLVKQSENPKLAWETGVRLGQMGEFSLLLIIIASQAQLISERAFNLVQLTTIISFIVSVYWIVARYPSPIAPDERLRKD